MENQPTLKSKSPRDFCFMCRRPRVGCYCSLIRPFDSTPRFIILTQPREAKHSLGTGRMAHLCLTNSLLIEGVDFSENEELNAILRDRKISPVVLYPRRASVNVSILSQEDRAAIIPAGQELVVIVPDGTWKTARKMVHLSRNLQNLTFISFDPPRLSRYRIRQQPRAHYYSTLEAIHHVIDLFMAHPQERPHDTLLEVFDFAVEHQLHYSPR